MKEEQVTQTASSDLRQLTPLGRKIESGSFQVIDNEVGPHSFGPEAWQIVRRVIHCTADFEYKELMRFCNDPIDSGVSALATGAPILLDVRMIEAGLNRSRLEHYGCATHCFISDPDVIADAKQANSTRAVMAMRKAHRLGLVDGAIIAVGNAPTSLLELKRLVLEEGAKPGLIIGVPVGFISAAESKAEIQSIPVPSIVSWGRKGGSPIAVSIIHALMYIATDRQSKKETLS
tara:strand:- start:134 stop:832 length:699 start_codon:yes stop_codon:yes gene_type:complete